MKKTMIIYNGSDDDDGDDDDGDDDDDDDGYDDDDDDIVDDILINDLWLTIIWLMIIWLMINDFLNTLKPAIRKDQLLPVRRLNRQVPSICLCWYVCCFSV